MKLPNDEIVHYRSDDGVTVIIERTELVRCKDCKWWTKQEDSLQGRCALMQSYPTGAWYCANGERKTNDE